MRAGGLCDDVIRGNREIMFPISPPKRIIAWFGPAIGPNAFQVGKEVIAQFMAFDPIAETAFRPDPNLARKIPRQSLSNRHQRLNKLGITQIYGSEHCTFTEKGDLFSYRRDGKTGRMARV